MKLLLNKNKGLIFLSIGLGLLLAGWFYYSSELNKDNEFNNNIGNINTGLTVGDGANTFDKKVDAYNAEIKDSLKKARNKGLENFDDFGKLNANTSLNTPTQTKQDNIQKKIDSILTSQQISYEEKTPKKTIKNRNYNPRKRERKVISSQKSKPIKSVKTQQEKDLEALRSWEAKMKAENKERATASAKNTPKETAPETFTDANILASINGDQELASGERLTIRLTNSAIIEDVEYSKNTFLYGFVKYAKNRIYISVNNIKGNPVNLGVYDGQDGGLGLYTTVNIIEKTINDVNDDSVNEIDAGNGTIGKIIKSGSKILKKKDKPQKILLMNQTKLILKKLK